MTIFSALKWIFSFARILHVDGELFWYSKRGVSKALTRDRECGDFLYKFPNFLFSV